MITKLAEKLNKDEQVKTFDNSRPVRSLIEAKKADHVFNHAKLREKNATSQRMKSDKFTLLKHFKDKSPTNAQNRMAMNEAKARAKVGFSPSKTQYFNINRFMR